MNFARIGVRFHVLEYHVRGSAQDMKTICFANDVTVLFAAKYLEEVTQIGIQAGLSMQQWHSATNQQLADRKTEAVLMTSREIM